MPGCYDDDDDGDDDDDNADGDDDDVDNLMMTMMMIDFKQIVCFVFLGVLEDDDKRFDYCLCFTL